MEILFLVYHRIFPAVHGKVCNGFLLNILNEGIIVVLFCQEQAMRELSVLVGQGLDSDQLQKVLLEVPADRV